MDKALKAVTRAKILSLVLLLSTLIMIYLFWDRFGDYINYTRILQTPDIDSRLNSITIGKGNYNISLRDAQEIAARGVSFCVPRSEVTTITINEKRNLVNIDEITIVIGSILKRNININGNSEIARQERIISSLAELQATYNIRKITSISAVMMTKNNFDIYFSRLNFKICDPYCEKGTKIFSSPYTEGIISLGRNSNLSNDFSVSFFDKSSDKAVHVLFLAKTNVIEGKIIEAIISTFRFS